jgi:hypothetical protein
MKADQRRPGSAREPTGLATKEESGSTFASPTTSTNSQAEEDTNVVHLTDGEFASGRGHNKAGEQGYRDPALSEAEMTDDAELNDWLWAMMTTLRAGNVSDKLYPPGE